MADFYGTEAGFEAYCEARAITAPAGDVEPALLRASVWLDGTYRDRFSGYRTQQRLQVREWPRYDAIDAECNGIPATEVPVEIIEATYEAALRELARPSGPRHLRARRFAGSHLLGRLVLQRGPSSSGDGDRRHPVPAARADPRLPPVRIVEPFVSNDDGVIGKVLLAGAIFTGLWIGLALCTFDAQRSADLNSLIGGWRP